MKHRHVVSAGLAAALALLVLLAPAAHALDPVGAFSRVQGTVSVKSGAAGKAVSAGDPVHLGDMVLTGPGARAELSLKDGSVITLSEDTEFTISRYDQGLSTAHFEMFRGAFRAVTGSIVKTSAPDFEIKTPLATIGVRGTDFWGGFFAAEELGVFMVSGKGVYVRNKTGRQIITRPGQGITVRSADASPEQPVIWKKEKVDFAVKTVTFD